MITPTRQGDGVLFSSDFFVSLFVSLSARLRENGWTDLHEIFREGVERPWDDLIQFWVNSGNRVGGSKVKLFVITDYNYLVWLLSSGSPVLPPSDWECNEIAVFGLSLRRSRGRGLLCPAPQLVDWLIDETFYIYELITLQLMHIFTVGLRNQWRCGCAGCHLWHSHRIASELHIWQRGS